MKRTWLLIAMTLLAAVTSARADYSVSDRGLWPKSWPQELEPLREHAATFEGPLLPARHFALHFTDREEFEAAWPHLLTLLPKDKPLILKRGHNFFLGEGVLAGVVIHVPPEDRLVAGQENQAESIELVVDADIIDLNRIPLPKDSPIQDERFQKSPQRSQPAERGPPRE